MRIDRRLARLGSQAAMRGSRTSRLPRMADELLHRGSRPLSAKNGPFALKVLTLPCADPTGAACHAIEECW
jgi:hypothetical protein